MNWREQFSSFDERRDLIIPGDQAKTLEYCIDHFLHVAQDSISDHGYFAVALSGGSTPKAIYQGLNKTGNKEKIDWRKVYLFWSDERCVPKDHPDSNYRMAMEAVFSQLPIPKSQIFPMNGVGDLEANALHYEKQIVSNIPKKTFDLVMLGMGEDGHTASLFPRTHGLHTPQRLVTTNFIPEKDVWRMTLTFDCINAADNIAIYVLGKSKAEIVKQVLTSAYEPDLFPVQRVGTPEHKALWILDTEASRLIT